MPCPEMKIKNKKIKLNFEKTNLQFFSKPESTESS